MLSLSLFGAAGLTAQADGGEPGRIIGKVVSEQTGDPISGANVMLGDGAAGALTNLDGRFMIQGVGPGQYDVTVQVIGYARKTVTGVDVAAGEMTQLDVSLSTEAVAVEGIRVSAAIEKGSTTALLSERRRSGVVVDAIGAEQISRSPDGDVAAVLARAPGVSIVDDKYVYVRGLGDRYGAASLNGSALPSPEPDKKTVPLDIVPSSFLESVVTAKTYSPDQPGDYAGGLVQIRTRNFPAQRTVRFSAGTSYNTAATFETGLLYPGGGLDFLAWDDGTRALPGDLPEQRVDNLSDSDLERIGEQFLGPWGGTQEKLSLPQSFSLAIGNEMAFFDDEIPVGYLLAVNQSTGYTHRGDLVERVYKAADEPEVDFQGVSTTRTAAVGGLFNLAADITPTNRLSFSTIYNRSADDNARLLQGDHLDFGARAQTWRLRYLSQSLLSSQLKGEHELGILDDLRVEWRGAVARATRYEPNTRDVVYRERQGELRYTEAKQSGSVFHSDLEEWSYAGGLDLDLPFAFRGLPATFSVGGSADYKDRENFLRRFRFEIGTGLPNDVLQLGPNELFVPEHVNAEGLVIQEVTFPEDNYEADQRVLAGYAMLDMELLPRLRLVGGARIEDSRQEVLPTPRFVQTVSDPEAAELSNTDVLPGVNLTYEVSDALNLRLAASRTLARPQFRELAPFQFTDYVGGFLTIGNPALVRTTIANYDVRAEWYPALGALIAVSGFYKNFSDPIETAALPSNELQLTWVNAENAENYGLELEARTSLGFLGGWLDRFALNANVSLVESTVSTGDSIAVWLPLEQEVGHFTVADRERALQGQSPYMVNVGLSYGSPGGATNVTLLYNEIGDRIDAVGARTLPDIHEEGRGVLDLVIDQELIRGFSAKLSGKNLLGTEVEFTQDDRVVRSYDPGRVFSLSVSWSLDG